MVDAKQELEKLAIDYARNHLVADTLLGCKNALDQISALNDHASSREVRCSCDMHRRTEDGLFEDDVLKRHVKDFMKRTGLIEETSYVNCHSQDIWVYRFSEKGKRLLNDLGLEG